MISLLSRVADTRRSYSCAVGPPTSVPRRPPARRPRAARGIVSIVVEAYGSPLKVTASCTPALALTRPGARRLTMSLCCLSAAVTAAAFAASPTITSAGADAPAGKLRESTSWPWTESTSPRNWLPVVWLGVEVEEVGGEHQQDDRADDPDRPRPPRDAVAHPPPEAVRLVRARLAGVGDRVQAGRPERLAAADRQQRGQDGQHRDHRQRDAHRADRPEPRGAS